MSMTVIVVFLVYLIAIAMGQLSSRPGVKAVMALAILTAIEVGVVILLMFTMDQPDIK